MTIDDYSHSELRYHASQLATSVDYWMRECRKKDLEIRALIASKRETERALDANERVIDDYADKNAAQAEDH